MFYDIGLVVMMNGGIGNGIVNFALYCFLKDSGHTVLMINVLNAQISGCEWKESYISLPYEESVISKDYGKGKDLCEMNQSCGMFLLGSDQLLRAKFVKETDFDVCLPWVKSAKYKAAYAASFGSDIYEDECSRKKAEFFFHRFRRLSVREKSGVDLLKNEFGLDGEWVLDPTFLCNKEHYKKMAQRGLFRIPKEKYVAAYLLDMENLGECAIRAAEKRCGVKEHLAILESQLQREDGYSGSMNTMPGAKVEEWLALIQNSEFVITDSFHGLCFSLIFQKNFLVIFDKECWRGNARFDSILSLLHLTDRIVYSAEDMSHAFELPDIDYTRVNAVLKREKDRSMRWLMDTVHQGLHFEGQSVQEMQLVLWGAGDCFVRNYDRIRRLYPIRYVCDSNEEKWGTYPADGVRCIPPEQLKALGDVFVLITVDNPGVSMQIVNRLLDMEISDIDHIQNWMEC